MAGYFLDRFHINYLGKHLLYIRKVNDFYTFILIKQEFITENTYKNEVENKNYL